MSMFGKERQSHQAGPWVSWLICLMLGWLLAASAHARTDIQVISKARVSPGQCSKHLGSPYPITLPERPETSRTQVGKVECYRFTLPLPYSPVVPWALRIDRLHSTHRIIVNGVALSTAHMSDEQVTSLSTLPYLVEVPAGLLHDGDNLVQIDSRMGPFYRTGISAMQAGPLDEMRADFDRWHAWTVDLPRTVNLCVAGIALFLLVVWHTRTTDKRFAYFCALMVILCTRNAVYLFETVTWPALVVNWLFYVAQTWGNYYLLAFGITYAGEQVRRNAWYMHLLRFGLPLLALIFALTKSEQALFYLRVISFPIMLLAGMIVVYKVIRQALQQGWQEAVVMTVGTLSFVVSVGHDYLLITGTLPADQLFWTPYTTPVIFLGYAVTLVRHFVANMALAERMNITLEERVAERTRALELANQSKTRFLAAASHDLRQPTAAIGLLVSLLRQQPSASKDTRELTDMLDEAVAAMESLLVGLLDISRLDAGAVQPKFQAVSLQDVFQAVKVHEQSAAQAKGLSLRFRLPRHCPDPLMVMTDPLLVHSVLRNLLSNAIRYTHEGGVMVAARRSGPRRIRIEVWDTGIGIAPDQLERIFEEFYQVGNAARDRSHGIGLGLAIVRRTANVLGEDVSARSRLGKGSVFAFELSLHHEQPVKASAAPIPTAQPLQGRTIWLVEDDLLMRRAMSELLQNWGAHVRHWTEGESLLGELPILLGQNSGERHPDALVTDYRLPGVDGVSLSQALAAELTARDRPLPTLIISGDTDPHEIARLNASGMHVLAKPFRSERLLAQVLSMIQSAHPAASPP
jgi:signal transduction histidine kinase/CheY-like chemotaxis protein